MAVTSSPSGTPLFAEGGAGTLRLLVYLSAAMVLMVLDYRGGYLQHIRTHAALLAEPMYYAAGAPVRGARWLRDTFNLRHGLADDNARLRAELLVAQARLNRLDALQAENARLRVLLQGTHGFNLKVQLAQVKDVDLDPFRHRVLLDIGTRDGAAVGMAVIDGHGVFGQVIEATPHAATAMLVSDPNHAVPVQVVRSGLRSVAYGTGSTDRLDLPNIPLSADIQVGDRLVTSGLGGRFPAGFDVAVVTAVRTDETRMFAVAEATPTAALARSGDVLLLRAEPVDGAADAMGPPAPDAPTPEPTP